MTEHRADFARLDTLGFRLTPRRREVLWYIAYETIQWPPGSRDIWITPFGMAVLLNGIPQKEPV